SMKSQNYTIIIPGMGSDHCANIVKESLLRHEAVQEVSIVLSRHQVGVRTASGGASPAELKAVVEKAGYEVASVRAEEEDEADELQIEDAYLARARRNLWLGMTPAAVIMALMMVHMFWVPIPCYLVLVTLLAFPTVFVAGWETHRPA